MRVKDTQKEQLIRKKTMELVVKHGFDGLSMHKLAKAANVSVNTIYLNFKNREDLLVQVYAGVIGRMEEQMLKNFHEDLDFAEGLRIQWKNRLEYYIKHPTEIHFIEQLRYSPLFDKTMGKQGQEFAQIQRRFCANAIKKKQLKPLTEEVYWAIAYAPLYQLLKFNQQKRSMSGKKFTLTQEKVKEALAQVLIALKP